MEVFLDSNFIISCVKRKIDFISQLNEKGFKIILPREVYQELKDLKGKLPHDGRAAIEIAMKLFDSNKIKKTTLGNQSVDMGLIDKGRKGHYIATLDAALKRQVKNRIVISNSKNAIEIERD